MWSGAEEEKQGEEKGKQEQAINKQPKKKHKTTFQIIWPSFWQGLHQGA